MVHTGLRYQATTSSNYYYPKMAGGCVQSAANHCGCFRTIRNKSMVIGLWSFINDIYLIMITISSMELLKSWMNDHKPITSIKHLFISCFQKNKTLHPFPSHEWTVAQLHEMNYWYRQQIVLWFATWFDKSRFPGVFHKSQRIIAVIGLKSMVELLLLLLSWCKICVYMRIFSQCSMMVKYGE